MYDLIEWHLGERPVWWRSDATLWRFETDSGHVFSTPDLEEAYLQLLGGSHKRTVDETRRALFLSAPKSVMDVAVRIDSLGVIVELTLAAPVIREAVHALADLRENFVRMEKQVNGQVLQVAQNYAVRVQDVRSAADDAPQTACEPLFDPDSEHHYLGLTAPEMRALAAGSRCYELQQLCVQQIAFEKAERVTRNAQTADEREERKNRREFKVAASRQWQQRQEKLRRFMQYMQHPDFVAQNEAEHCALLHYQVAKQKMDEWLAAETSIKKELAFEHHRLARERDNFILKYIVDEQTADVLPSVSECLVRLRNALTIGGKRDSND